MVQPEPGGSLEGVSETALGAAEMRAEESHRPDRLFDDPFAAAFVAAAPPLFPDIPSLADDAELAALIEASIAGIAIRTRFYDEYLASACAAGCRQVVLLAAGLDTRCVPSRLAGRDARLRARSAESVRVQGDGSGATARRRNAHARLSPSTFEMIGPLS